MPRLLVKNAGSPAAWPRPTVVMDGEATGEAAGEPPGIAVGLAWAATTATMPRISAGMTKMTSFLIRTDLPHGTATKTLAGTDLPRRQRPAPVLTTCGPLASRMTPHPSDIYVLPRLVVFRNSSIAVPVRQACRVTSAECRVTSAE